MISFYRATSVTVLLVGCLTVRPALAQRRAPVLSLSAGPAHYSLSGTGTGFIGAIRVDVPSGTRFIIEPGVNYFRYTTALGDRINYLMPEISFQYQLATAGVRPYLGAGIGEVEFLSGRGSSDVAFHAAAGLRTGLGGPWGLRGEVRARTIDPFSGSTIDFTVGISRRLR